jgi:hypothetical protein
MPRGLRNAQTTLFVSHTLPGAFCQVHRPQLTPERRMTSVLERLLPQAIGSEHVLPAVIPDRSQGRTQGTCCHVIKARHSHKLIIAALSYRRHRTRPPQTQPGTINEMLPQIFLALAAASLSSAHFILEWPPTAGFDDDLEGTSPCGSATVSVNSSSPQIQVDRFAISIMSTHPVRYPLCDAEQQFRRLPPDDYALYLEENC